MSVHIHSNSQDVATVWDESDKAGLAMRERAAGVWLQGCGELANTLLRPLDELNLRMKTRRLGTSYGQFTAWLPYPSDTVGQPDYGTARGIQTVLIELPFANPLYNNYYNGLFQSRPKDGSDSFHPSGRNTRALIRKAFIPMALYFIRQAASPSCATRNTSAGEQPIPGGRATSDLGFVAARIAPATGEGNSITTVPAEHSLDGEVQPAYDAVTPGQHAIEYIVQNYGIKKNDGIIQLSVESRHAGTDGKWTAGQRSVRRLRSIDPLTNVSGRFRLRVALNREYRITAKVPTEKDDFELNNLKVWRFITLKNESTR